MEYEPGATYACQFRGALWLQAFVNFLNVLVVRSSNSAGMDSRIKLRFSADEVATFSKAPIFDRKNAGCSCMKDFSVARGSNNGVTNNRAKFRFPGDKTFPWLMMQTTGGWTSRASLPLPSRQAFKTLHIFFHLFGLNCLWTYKLTANVSSLEVTTRATILPKNTDDREMIGVQAAHVKS
ncbi:uncharacterized protein [Dermacentor albipictus]|uniref:uncharacterized protein n=1 Tax=Dermacentor albipictus TaxID=60249 RepID=UPI0031FC727C